MDFTHLETIDSRALDEAAQHLVKREGACQAELIAHLAEIGRRKLHLDLGYSSLFEYGRVRLGFCEGSVYLRLQVAKVAREFPQVLTLLADGRFNLTALGKLSPILTHENFEQVIRDCERKRKAEIEEYVARLSPRKEVKSSIRRRRQKKGPMARNNAAEMLASSRTNSNHSLGADPNELDRERINLLLASSKTRAFEVGGAASDRSAEGENLLLASSRARAFEVSGAASDLGREGTKILLASSWTRAGEVGDGAFRLGREGAEKMSSSSRTGAPQSDDFEQKRERAEMKPATGERYNFRFAASRELKEKIERLAEVMGIASAAEHLEEILDQALELALEKKDPIRKEARRVEKEKRAQSKKKHDDAKPTSEDQAQENEEPFHTPQEEARTRYIPKSVRTKALRVAGYRCEYRSHEGRRCEARMRLEFDHVVAFAHGGSSRGPNIRVLCAAHNKRKAEEDLGAAFVARKIQARQTATATRERANGWW